MDFRQRVAYLQNRQLIGQHKNGYLLLLQLSDGSKAPGAVPGSGNLVGFGGQRIHQNFTAQGMCNKHQVLPGKAGNPFLRSQGTNGFLTVGNIIPAGFEHPAERLFA